MRLTFAKPPPRNVFADIPFSIDLMFQADQSERALNMPLEFILMDDARNQLADQTILKVIMPLHFSFSLHFSLYIC